MQIYTGKLKSIYEQLKDKAIQLRKEGSKFKSYRQELISELTKLVNKDRKGTQYKLLNEGVISVLVNRNPFLAGKNNNGELKMLIDECKEQGNCKKFWWIIRNK